MSIRDIVKNTYATFHRYFDGNLYYRITKYTGEYYTIAFYDEAEYKMPKKIIYEFPIPLSDTKGATFNSEEKSLLLMRWIRKAKEDNTLKIIE